MNRRGGEKILQGGATTWFFPALCALLLNMLFFLAIPNLVHDKAPRHSVDKMVSGVRFLRLKPHQQPMPPRKKKKQQPEKKPQKKKATQPHNRPVLRDLALPFQLNPKLPEKPSRLELPPLIPSSSFHPGKLPKVFQAGQLDRTLTPTVRIPPVYPMRARRRGIEGWVKVRFVVNSHGNVTDITVLEAHPERIFNKAVKSCLRQWHFQPGTVSGMVVDAEVTTTIRFKLEQ
ncbi:energy transducer TonB [Desulfomarina sp.]